jgi:cytochrome c oxidase subunit 1
MSRRVANYPDLPGNVAMLNRISTIGSFILGASTLFCLYNVYKTWRFGQRVPADGPVGVRELAGVGDLLPAARAQLHPDPADPLRAPSVRSALPAHQVRPGQAARLVRPARRLGRQYRQPGQDEAARGSYERGWPARPAGRGDGRDTRQRVGGKRQGWGCRVAYRIHRENPQPPGARAARHRDCFP